jgi:hypothetical protein
LSRSAAAAPSSEPLALPLLRDPNVPAWRSSQQQRKRASAAGILIQYFLCGRYGLIKLSVDETNPRRL